MNVLFYVDMKKSDTDTMDNQDPDIQYIQHFPRLITTLGGANVP